jgi:flagellar biosynthesis protein FlhB
VSDDAGEKTEAPTGKRREDARQEGQIAKSPELMTAAFLIGSTFTLSHAGPPLWRFQLASRRYRGCRHWDSARSWR